MKKLLSLFLALVFTACLISPMAATEVYAASGVVMTVNGTEYTDHGTGWSAAVKLAAGETEVKVKLFADWEADATTGFACPDGGTNGGALYVGGGKFTLDLNGYTLDRNAPKDKYYSSVLYVENCTFTLDDTSEEKTGAITGGYAQYGGGIYAEDVNLNINGGNITKNKAEEGGGVYSWEDSMTMNGGCISHNEANNAGGIYIYGTVFVMNNGSITDNEAQNGGAVLVNRNVYTTTAGIDLFTMNDGVIARNRSTINGGGIYGFTRSIINGGIIEENYAGGEGGAVYIGNWSVFKMNGGILRNNTAYYHGGGISNNNVDSSDENDDTCNLTVKHATITGNVSLNGNGGGINWDDREVLYLMGCTITGNSAPRGYGGGVFASEKTTNVTLTETVNITGNTAFTGCGNNTSNLFVESDSEFGIMHRHIEKDFWSNITYDEVLAADSKIGVSFGKVDFSSKNLLNTSDAELTSEMADCFFSDSPHYVIAKEKNSDGYYDTYLIRGSSGLCKPSITVETQKKGKKDFCFIKDGWSYALEESETSDVIITLHSDWIAGGGYFKYYDSGTYEGCLYIPDSCTNITIDLNGYTIDRNLKVQKQYGSVFYMDTYGSLTIMDSSEAKTGKITGGHSTYELRQFIGYGGAFYVDYGKLYLKDITLTGNAAVYGGAIYCDDQDDAYVYLDGTKIYGNTSLKDGGGIYMENGYFYMEDGEITGNSARNGGGVYWASDNAGYFIGGKIDSNSISENGAGVYAANYGKIYLGGDININSLYLGSSNVDINNACGQNGAPNKPLSDGASIGIYAETIEDEISEDGSMFREGDFRYLHSVLDSYFIRSVYNEEDGDHAHKLYINTWGNIDARYPRVKTVSVKNSNLLADAVLDYDTQTITLVAHNTKKNFFERASLSDLIEYTCDKNTYYLYETEFIRDLRKTQEYKIMSDNGTYVMCIVKVVPEGGAWADNQESVDNPYKMMVAHGTAFKGFENFNDGWSYAVSQNKPVIVTLFADWTATNGKFDYSSGTEYGCLYMNNANLDITIDLNGYTIDRGLKSAISDGQVFKIDNGKLTITDSIGTGKITGGNTTGYGGAFWVEYGTLRIKGGEISGNKAEYGGAIYCNDLDDAFVYIEGGKLTDNTATENGGGIYMENGYLYVSGGEINGNKAVEGAGVYWASNNAGCFTGGIITNNTAAGNGGGIYGTDWGYMYFGGTVVISGNKDAGNSPNNLYLSANDVYVNRAAGQSDEIPDVPFTDGASIGISMPGTDGTVLISGSDSRFDSNNFGYFFGDNSSYFVRAVFDEAGANNTHKLYYNKWSYKDAVYPKITTVASRENNGLISEASIDLDKQIITLKAISSDRRLFKSVVVEKLVSFVTSNNADVYWRFCDMAFDLSKPKEYKVVSKSTGTYVHCRVIVEFPECMHNDSDGNYICDYCEEHIFKDFTIADYNAQTKEATMFITKAGRYTLAFADYENNRLANVYIAEYDFKEGINVVTQEVTSFTLTNGDKVMLWYDMTDHVPICEALTVE